MNKLNALLVGESTQLMCSLPYLLFRSGFTKIDVITANPFIYKSKFISTCEVFYEAGALPLRAIEKDLDQYDLIVVCDDRTINSILKSNISDENKLKLLPVNDYKDFKHLYSKIGLSQVLAEANVPTPPFAPANNFSEVVTAAEKIGYPVMIKVNSSGGGHGVFECCTSADLDKFNTTSFQYPLLVQKKIKGREVDLSAFYQNGKLIHFSRSTLVKIIVNKFGISSVRNYKQLSEVDKEIFSEVSKLGEALGANGFVSVSVIESSEDGKRYFFEADVRPNAWADITRFFGDDVAVRISSWFSKGETLQYPYAFNAKFPAEITIPYFLRASVWEILFNLRNVRKYIFREDNELFRELLYIEVFKPFIKKIERIPANLVKAVISKKEDRIKIKELLRKKIFFLPGLAQRSSIK